MSVSHRGITGDLDANIGSPQKLSYEGSPSPDFNFDSSSPTSLRRTVSICESRSPSPPISFSSNFSQSINSPLHSPLTSSSSDSSPMKSPTSPYTTTELSTAKSFSRSRSLSPNYHPPSPPSLPSHRNILTLSPNNAFSFIPSNSSPLSPLKEIPLRERCEIMLKSRSLIKKHDNFHSKPISYNNSSEIFADSDPFMPFVFSNNSDQENLKPSSSLLVIPQPSHSKTKYSSTIPSSDDKQSFVADTYYPQNDSSFPTSSLLERCEALLKVRDFKKNIKKSKSCNKPSANEIPFTCSSTSCKENLRQSKTKSVFNSDHTQPSHSLGKNAITYPYSKDNQNLAADAPTLSLIANSEPSSPVELAPISTISPPPYHHDYSHSELYSPPPYQLSPSHSFLSNAAVSPYHDYPSVTISCASSLYANSPDNIMSVTVTTCSSTGSNGTHGSITPDKLKLNNIQPPTSSGQQVLLYNPPLNPQDYQTSPPIYKSSTSVVPDRHSYDFRSSPLPSSSIMYSYAPFSPHSLASKVSSTSKSSFNANSSERQSTFSPTSSQFIPGSDSQKNSAQKTPDKASFSHKHSSNTFQLPMSNANSNDSSNASQLKLHDVSVLQSNEISDSSQGAVKSGTEINKLFPLESSSNAICGAISNMLDPDTSHSSSPKVEPNLIIKTDSPIAEIVDVEHQGPPSVVDLTCEDDDDVEIVSTDQPVVFLGSEPSTRRLSRRLRRIDNSLSSSSSSEPIIINDSPLDNAGDSPSTAINISDFIETTVSTSTVVNTHTDVGYEGHRTPQLFGDLFNQSVIPIDSDNDSKIPRNNRNLPSTSNHRSNLSAVIRKQMRRERSRDRSRSPLARNEDLDPVEAPIPPDVLDDIASLYAESQTSHRLPVSLYKKNIFSTASDILHKAAYGLSNICMLTSHTRPISSQVPQPSTSSSDDSGGLSCPICFETFQDIKKAGKSLSSTVCGHIFCTNCLEAALKQTKLCPTCRKKLNKKQYHPLYI